ncbi:hypothetical protein GYH30_035124 [Glycine max]|uniref:Uncharacterized protein n=1 Tax=Glycine max TaxID=3847 RepID=K7LXV8_SOYBN|nr:hypothetical protein GYH30_035124 [Glycine max]
MNCLASTGKQLNRFSKPKSMAKSRSQSKTCHDGKARRFLLKLGSEYYSSGQAICGPKMLLGIENCYFEFLPRSKVVLSRISA